MAIRARGARVALTILAAVTLAACGGSDGGGSGGGSGAAAKDPIPEQFRRDYVAGCIDSGQSKVGCDCLFEQLTQKQGVDTEAKIERLSRQVVEAAQTPDPAAAVPPEFRKAALACKSSLR